MWCHEAACNKDSGKPGNVPGSNICFPSGHGQSCGPSGCSAHPWLRALALPASPRLHRRSQWHWVRWQQSHQWRWGAPRVPVLVCLQLFRESYCFLLLLTCKMELICLILMQPVLLGNAKLKAASVVSPGIVPKGFLHKNKDKVIIYYVKAMYTSFLNNRTTQPNCALHGQMFTYLFGINTFVTGFAQGTMIGSPS